jgi:DNA-binding NarL/FixJ family response regulator
VVTKPRLIIADDHRLLLDGLRLMLEPEFELAGIVEDGQSLLDAAGNLTPDVILLDIGMPTLNGIDAARQLRKISPQSKVIFLTMHSEPAYIAEAFRCGAAGYLLKHSASSELLNAIREVLNGGHYVSPLIAETCQQPQFPVFQTGKGDSSDTLTPRQREVLSLVASGCSRKEIAARLNISVKTVEFHKAALARGFRLRTTADFTRYAIEHGFIDTKQN